MKRFFKVLFVLALVGAAIGAGAWYMRRSSGTVTYRTAPVKRGDLVATISATGTLEPEEVVDVGAQVAGMIKSFGTDANGKPIDYGAQVEQGTVLARIDDSLYAADVASTTAQLEQDKAALVRAQADLGQLQAKLVQAQKDWERAQKLGPSDALAPTAFDSYKAGYEVAKANLAVGEAAISQAKGTVLEAEAVLARAKRNLDYCTITSPVKGVIIDRRVNTGQTVVSSLNAPSLFLIAKDLMRMQIWVSVNEADIGNIHPGQAVTYTVDAFPGRTFKGQVGKVRLNAAMTQNVVTYTVEVNTDNPEGKLLPYLTANVKFEVERRDNTLMVPVAALRWSPTSPEQIAPEAQEPTTAQPQAGPRERSANGDQAPAGERRHGTLWAQEGAFVKPIRVKIGLSDGANTEVTSDKLKEGMQVITGLQQQGQGDDDARNPFLPQFGRRNQNSGSGR